jgi:hypothetical protein
VKADAYVSNDKLYRYWLSRIWDATLPVVIFLCLNPSTADALKNDQTIHKVMRYAKAWGFGGVIMINLYAFRARKPNVMLSARDPVGPHNDRWLYLWWEQARRTGAPIVCAWGNNAKSDRVTSVLRMARECGITLHVLKLGKTSPSHPLYLKGDLTPTSYSEQP